MGHSQLQGVFQSFGDIHRIAGGFLGGEFSPAFHEFPKVAPFDEFHGQVMLVAIAADFVNRHDVLVLQPLAQFTLATEQGDRPRVVGPALTQHLDPDHAPVIDRATAKHPCETAGGIAVHQLVGPQAQRVRLAFFQFGNLIRRQQVSAFHLCNQRIDPGRPRLDCQQTILQHSRFDKLELQQERLKFVERGERHWQS